VQRWDSNAWEDYSGDFCKGDSSTPILLGRDQSVTHTKHWEASGKFRLRLVYGVSDGPLYGNLAVGPAFEVQ
jgi:hypothetical protein